MIVYSSAKGYRLKCAIQQFEGAAVASAGTVTPNNANAIPITGTTTINFVTVSNMQFGTEVEFRFSADVTLTHAAASPPGGTVALALAGSVNAAMHAGSSIRLRYLSTGVMSERGRVAA